LESAVRRDAAWLCVLFGEWSAGRRFDGEACRVFAELELRATSAAVAASPISSLRTLLHWTLPKAPLRPLQAPLCLLSKAALAASDSEPPEAHLSGEGEVEWEEVNIAEGEVRDVVVRRSDRRVLMVWFSYEHRFDVLRRVLGVLFGGAVRSEAAVRVTVTVVVVVRDPAHPGGEELVREFGALYGCRDASDSSRLATESLVCGDVGLVGRNVSGTLFAQAARDVLFDHFVSDPSAFDGVGFWEDDHAVSAEVVRGTLQVQEALDRTGAQWTVGHLQFETSPDTGEAVLVSQGGLYNAAWWLMEAPKTLHLEEGGWQFVVTDNVHQGGFLTTATQMQRWINSGCLQRGVSQSHWFYPPIEAVDSEPFYACGHTRVVPLPSAALTGQAWVRAFGVEHVTQRYVRLPSWSTDIVGGVGLTAHHLLSLLRARTHCRGGTLDSEDA
jgi:hypothetical protein